MKKGKEWFIKELIGHEIGDYGNYYNGGYEDGLAYALELAHQLDEPEKVVVPKFVAEWYEESKDELEFDIFNLVATIGEKDYDELTEIEAWFNNIGNDPIETIMKMKLFGYKTEKEKLYYTVDEKGQTLLLKSEEGIIRSNGTDLEIVLNVYEHAPYNMYQLTEKQIKDYDERYWPFAVEVTE